MWFLINYSGLFSTIHNKLIRQRWTTLFHPRYSYHSIFQPISNFLKFFVWLASCLVYRYEVSIGDELVWCVAALIIRYSCGSDVAWRSSVYASWHCSLRNNKLLKHTYSKLWSRASILHMPNLYIYTTVQAHKTTFPLYGFNVLCTVYRDTEDIPHFLIIK